MNTRNIARRGVAGYAPTLAATIAVALAFISCTEYKEIKFFTADERAVIMARGSSSSSEISSSSESSSSSAPILLQCGLGTYNSGTHFCFGGNTITELCGGKTYSVYQFCGGGKVYDYCNGAAYNSAEYICCDNKQEDIKKYGCCDNSRYTLATHFCHTDGNTYSCSDLPLNPSTQFCDVREGGKVYKWVKIDKQVWMAENLNYDVSGSKCYDNESANCEKYGRLYNWSTAMSGICPPNWHLPSDAEWTTLTGYVESNSGCSNCAGTHLKSASGWNSYNGIVNSDTYGFSALPGGYGDSGGLFNYVGLRGYWWSSSEYNSSNAYYRSMSNNSEFVDNYNVNKSRLFSVRCVKD